MRKLDSEIENIKNKNEAIQEILTGAESILSLKHLVKLRECANEISGIIKKIDENKSNIAKLREENAPTLSLLEKPLRQVKVKIIGGFGILNIIKKLKKDIDNADFYKKLNEIEKSYKELLHLVKRLASRLYRFFTSKILRITLVGLTIVSCIICLLNEILAFYDFDLIIKRVFPFSFLMTIAIMMIIRWSIIKLSCMPTWTLDALLAQPKTERIESIKLSIEQKKIGRSELIEMVKIFSERWLHYHKHYWNLAIKTFTVTVSLMALPFILSNFFKDPNLMKNTASFPLISMIITVFLMMVLKSEEARVHNMDLKIKSIKEALSENIFSDFDPQIFSNAFINKFNRYKAENLVLFLFIILISAALVETILIYKGIILTPSQIMQNSANQ